MRKWAEDTTRAVEVRDPRRSTGWHRPMAGFPKWELDLQYRFADDPEKVSPRHPPLYQCRTLIPRPLAELPPSGKVYAPRLTGGCVEAPAQSEQAVLWHAAGVAYRGRKDAHVRAAAMTTTTETE